MLHLPTKTATISFEHLAVKLHEDPSDLLLMLVGLQLYSKRNSCNLIQCTTINVK